MYKEKNAIYSQSLLKGKPSYLQCGEINAWRLPPFSLPSVHHLTAIPRKFVFPLCVFPLLSKSWMFFMLIHNALQVPDTRG